MQRQGWPLKTRSAACMCVIVQPCLFQLNLLQRNLSIGALRIYIWTLPHTHTLHCCSDHTLPLTLPPCSSPHTAPLGHLSGTCLKHCVSSTTKCVSTLLSSGSSASGYSWLSIGGDDDSSTSFVVNSSMTNESTLCWECAVTDQTCVQLQSESLAGEGNDASFADVLAYFEIYNQFHR